MSRRRAAVEVIQKTSGTLPIEVFSGSRVVYSIMVTDVSNGGLLVSFEDAGNNRLLDMRRNSANAGGNPTLSIDVTWLADNGLFIGSDTDATSNFVVTVLVGSVGA